ncbi:MAG: hypothetical protein U0X73_06270 [Thermoanaerobaculia bacterium]
MPTLDQVLQRVEGPDDRLDATGRYVDPLLPRFHRLAEIAPGEVGSWQARDVAPSPGGDHLLRISYRVQGPDDDDPDEGPFLLECLAAPSGSVAWRSEVYYADRFEFAADNPDLFYYLDTARGGGVFSLSRGLICPLAGASRENRGSYSAWPTFSRDASTLFYGFANRLEALDLATCTTRHLGDLIVDRPAGPKELQASSTYFSLSGDRALGLAREEVRGPIAPTGWRPFRAAYFSLPLDRALVPSSERRVVFGRLFNDLLGIEGTALQAVAEPLITVNQLRSRDGGVDFTGRKTIDSLRAQACFLLIRNAHGRFFGLSTKADSRLGLELDRGHALLRFGAEWWDLKPLGSWDADDMLSK